MNIALKMAAAMAGVSTGQPSQVSLLLHGDSASPFLDSSSYAQTVTTGGTVTCDTSDKVFGAGAISFGANGYLSIPDNDRFNFGTGEFAIDLRVKSPGGTMIFFAQGSGTSKMQLYSVGTTLRWYVNGTDLIIGSISNTVYNHVELSRTSGVLSAYVEGTRTYNAANTDNTHFAGDFILGFDTGSAFSNGLRLDEFRVQKGAYGHTGASFTIPTSPY